MKTSKSVSFKLAEQDQDQVVEYFNAICPPALSKEAAPEVISLDTQLTLALDRETLLLDFASSSSQTNLLLHKRSQSLELQLAEIKASLVTFTQQFKEDLDSEFLDTSVDIVQFLSWKTSELITEKDHVQAYCESLEAKNEELQKYVSEAMHMLEGGVIAAKDAYPTPPTAPTKTANDSMGSSGSIDAEHLAFELEKVSAQAGCLSFAMLNTAFQKSCTGSVDSECCAALEESKAGLCRVAFLNINFQQSLQLHPPESSFLGSFTKSNVNQEVGLSIQEVLDTDSDDTMLVYPLESPISPIFTIKPHESWSSTILPEEIISLSHLQTLQECASCSKKTKALDEFIEQHHHISRDFEATITSLNEQLRDSSYEVQTLLSTQKFVLEQHEGFIEDRVLRHRILQDELDNVYDQWSEERRVTEAESIIIEQNIADLEVLVARLETIEVKDSIEYEFMGLETNSNLTKLQLLVDRLENIQE